MISEEVSNSNEELMNKCGVFKLPYFEKENTRLNNRITVHTLEELVNKQKPGSQRYWRQGKNGFTHTNKIIKLTWALALFFTISKFIHYLLEVSFMNLQIIQSVCLLVLFACSHSVNKIRLNNYWNEHFFMRASWIYSKCLFSSIVTTHTTWEPTKRLCTYRYFWLWDQWVWRGERQN